MSEQKPVDAIITELDNIKKYNKDHPIAGRPVLSTLEVGGVFVNDKDRAKALLPSDWSKLITWVGEETKDSHNSDALSGLIIAMKHRGVDLNTPYEEGQEKKPALATQLRNQKLKIDGIENPNIATEIQAANWVAEKAAPVAKATPVAAAAVKQRKSFFRRFKHFIEKKIINRKFYSQLKKTKKAVQTQMKTRPPSKPKTPPPTPSRFRSK
jgi:hypothetical protein